MIALSNFRQSLAGSFRFEGDGREHPMSLELCATKPSFLPRLSGGLMVEGQLDARGLAERRPVGGRVLVDPLIPFSGRYELELTADDGRPLTLTAERKPSPKSLFWSASTVRGEIRDSTKVVLARFELRLDYRRNLGRQLL